MQITNYLGSYSIIQNYLSNLCSFTINLETVAFIDLEVAETAAVSSDKRNIHPFKFKKNRNYFILSRLLTTWIASMAGATLVATLCATAFTDISQCLKALSPVDHIAPHQAWELASSFLSSAATEKNSSDGSPRQLHLSLGENENELRVTWVTTAECQNSQVFYGGELKRQADATTYSYSTPPRWWGTFNGHIHSAILTELSPMSSMLYQVGVFGDNNSDCAASNITIANVPQATGTLPVKLALMADVGSVMPLGFTVWRALIERAESLGVEMAVHVGDVSYAGMDTSIKILNVSSDDEFEPLWDLYGEVHAPFTQNYPYQVGVGNHEAWYNWTAIVNRYPMSHQGSSDESSLARPPFWYAFNTGGVRIVMLSSEHNDPEQLDFARAALEAVDRARTPWLVVTFHKPYYCSDNGYTHEELRAQFEPLMLTYGVDVVVNGHEHGYERIHPTDNFSVTDYPTTTSADGSDIYKFPKSPLYLMIGNGGAGQTEKWDLPAPSWSGVRYSQGCDFTGGIQSCGFLNGSYAYTDTYGFSVAEFVNSTHANFRTEMVSGQLRDEFWITK